MSLVDHDTTYGTAREEIPGTRAPERLGREVEEIDSSLSHPIEGVFSFEGGEETIDVSDIRDTLVVETLHLIFHEGLKR